VTEIWRCDLSRAIDLTPFGQQAFASQGRAEVIHIHAQGHSHGAVRVDGQLEGGIHQRKDGSTVRRAEEVVHILGGLHLEKCAALLKLHNPNAENLGIRLLTKSFL
jgi:hypothetical protein